MSIATELTEAGTPRVLYLSRSDVVAVGGDHSNLYLQTLRGALVAHSEGKVVQPLKPYLRAHGKAGVEDIACAAEVYTRAKQQIGTWLDLY